MIAALLLAATTVAPAPVPGELKTFGDWAVACDNGGRCEAVSLVPADAETGFDGPLVVTREAGPDGSLWLNVEVEMTGTGPWRLIAEGRELLSTRMQEEPGGLASGAAARRVIGRGLANARTARLVDAKGIEIARFSLAGSAAAFRYMDDRQGRAGTRGALVATGPAADSRPAPALPRIRPVTAADGRVPDAATLAKLGMSGPCAVERDGDGGPGDDAVAVDADAAGRPRAVALIACGNGAYNFSSAVYLLTLHGGEWRSEPARFDLPSDLYEGLATVVNADLTNELLELAAYAKGRGLGDCGVAHNWVWDGAMFRLTNMRRMDECRGSLVWPTVWRADIEGR